MREAAAFQKHAVEPYAAPLMRYGQTEYVVVVARKSDAVMYWEDVEEEFNTSPLAEDGANSATPMQPGQSWRSDTPLALTCAARDAEAVSFRLPQGYLERSGTLRVVCRQPGSNSLWCAKNGIVGKNAHRFSPFPGTLP